MGEATHEDAPQQEHVVRIPYSLEIEDKLPRGMPYPRQVADQIAADMIASGQVRMQMWELLCDILPTGDPRREACADHPGSMCFMSGAYSQGPQYGLRRNTTLLPWVSLLVCKYIRSCTNVPFTSFVLQCNTLMRAQQCSGQQQCGTTLLILCRRRPLAAIHHRRLPFPGRYYVWICEKSHTVGNHLRPTPMARKTRPWRGHRITIAIYTIKAVADLSPEHTDILRRLEFALPAATQRVLRQ